MNFNIIECDNEEQMAELKEKVMKCKIVALNKRGKSPLFNPRYMKQRDKDKLIVEIKELLGKPLSEIDEMFNDIVLDELLCEGKDVSTYPVYDIAGNKVIEKPDEVSLEVEND